MERLRFKWSPTPASRPADFWRADYNDASWARLTVPGNWELSGFGTPIYTNIRYPFPDRPPCMDNTDNPVGSHRVTFDLGEPSWADAQAAVYLHFGAVSSAFHCWLNGEYVGYYEDSKTAVEFGVRGKLRVGPNLLAVEVYRWSDGSYIEDQDMWRLSGIQRSVYLVRRPQHHIADIVAAATLDGSYRHGQLALQVALQQASADAPPPPNLRLEARLYPPARAAQAETPLEPRPALWDREVSIGAFHSEAASSAGAVARSAAHAELSMTVTDVQPWSAEAPTLYTLCLLLKHGGDDGGGTDGTGGGGTGGASGDGGASSAADEVVCLGIGFRSVEVKDAQLQVNGHPVLIRGVNRHEHEAETGHALSHEVMRLDAQRMKELNVNAVRTSHYPNDPQWYSLSDAHGLYVVCEANIESHGHEYQNIVHTLANDGAYVQSHLSRVRTMVRQHRNHPSVIIWSLGNEAGQGISHVTSYRWIKQNDPEQRPVQYEGASNWAWGARASLPSYPPWMAPHMRSWGVEAPDEDSDIYALMCARIPPAQRPMAESTPHIGAPLCAGTQAPVSCSNMRGRWSTSHGSRSSWSSMRMRWATRLETLKSACPRTMPQHSAHATTPRSIRSPPRAQNLTARALPLPLCLLVLGVRYWDAIHSHPSLQGGFIWDWVDQGLTQRGGLHVNPAIGAASAAYAARHPECCGPSVGFSLGGGRVCNASLCVLTDLEAAWKAKVPSTYLYGGDFTRFPVGAPCRHRANAAAPTPRRQRRAAATTTPRRPRLPLFARPPIFSFSHSFAYHTHSPRHSFAGPKGVISDRNFCINGLLRPDRQPNPHAWEVKKLYQPVVIEAVELLSSAPRLRLINRNSFLDLTYLSARWSLSIDGAIARHGALTLPAVGPGRYADVPISELPLTNLQQLCHQVATFTCVLGVSLHLRQGTSLLPPEFEEAWEEFPLPWRKPVAAVTAAGAAAATGAVAVPSTGGLSHQVGQTSSRRATECHRVPPNVFDAPGCL